MERRRRTWKRAESHRSRQLQRSDQIHNSRFLGCIDRGAVELRSMYNRVQNIEGCLICIYRIPYINITVSFWCCDLFNLCISLHCISGIENYATVRICTARRVPDPGTSITKITIPKLLSPPLAVIIKPHLQKILLPISLPLSLPLSLSSISNPTLPLRLLPLVRKPRLSWISLSLCSVVFFFFFSCSEKVLGARSLFLLFLFFCLGFH